MSDPQAPAVLLQPIPPEWAEAARDARALCESEARKWEHHSPTTAEHWLAVATRLGAIFLTQDHLGAEATVAQLRLDLEALQRKCDGRTAEVEHWVTRYNELEAWRASTSRLLLEANTAIDVERATCARLRAALEKHGQHDYHCAVRTCAVCGKGATYSDVNGHFDKHNPTYHEPVSKPCDCGLTALERR